jgi:hypothetical protein
VVYTFAFSANPVDNAAANDANGKPHLHGRQSRFCFDSRTPTDWRIWGIYSRQWTNTPGSNIVHGHQQNEPAFPR